MERNSREKPRGRKGLERRERRVGPGSSWDAIICWLVSSLGEDVGREREKKIFVSLIMMKWWGCRENGFTSVEMVWANLITIIAIMRL